MFHRERTLSSCYGYFTSGLIKIRVALLGCLVAFIFSIVALCVVGGGTKKTTPPLQIAQEAAKSTNDFSDIWNGIREDKEVCLQKIPRARRVFAFSTDKKLSPEIMSEHLGHKIYLTIFLKAIILLL